MSAGWGVAAEGSSQLRLLVDHFVVDNVRMPFDPVKSDDREGGQGRPVGDAQGACPDGHVL